VFFNSEGGGEERGLLGGGFVQCFIVSCVLHLLAKLGFAADVLLCALIGPAACMERSRGRLGLVKRRISAYSLGNPEALARLQNAGGAAALRAAAAQGKHLQAARSRPPAWNGRVARLARRQRVSAACDHRRGAAAKGTALCRIVLSAPPAAAMECCCTVQTRRQTLC